MGETGEREGARAQPEEFSLQENSAEASGDEHTVMSGREPTGRSPELTRHDLVHVAEEMIECLREADRKQFLQAISSRGFPSLGTLCSGTDVCTFAAKAICKALTTKYSCSADVEHVFSCDSKAAAQSFILNVCKPLPVSLYTNVLEMGSMRADDQLSGGLQLVRPAGLLIAGFSCTDVSHMNKDHRAAKDTIAKGDKRTGGTFEGVRQYAARHGPKIMILENVTALDDINPETQTSNLTEVKKALQSIGFAVGHTVLSPTDHGCLHRRSRCIV